MRARQTAWVTHSHVRRWVPHTASVGQEITVSGWEDHGEIDWLITSARIVGRTRSGGKMISVWWGGLAGVSVDLDNDRITLNGANGWTGQLGGPGVAPLAVAAVAACHGRDALFIHPALASLRDPHSQPDLRPPQPKAIGSGATIVEMPRRGPTS